MKRGMAHIQPVASHQPFKVSRQVLRSRNSGAVEQDRDYGNVAFQRRRDFDADEISCAIQPPGSLLVPGIDPTWADQCEQHIAFGDLVAQNLYEIRSGADTGYVHE
jgi:hypothetical protein